MDECGVSTCPANTTCTNTPGSFACPCAPGYASDGSPRSPCLFAAPAFASGSFMFSVMEHETRSLPAFGQVLLSNVNPSAVRLSIVSGNAGGQFGINASGFLHILAPLDFETMPRRFELVVQAVTLARPARSGRTNVSLLVLDSNDQAPVPSLRTYYAFVSETAAPGTVVPTTDGAGLATPINATDADQGANAIVKYSLVVGSEFFFFF
jgi:hypothetical protein